MSQRKTISLLYGREGMDVSVPADTAVLRGQENVKALPDPVQAVRDGLRQPIGSPPLAELLRQSKPATVAITISDITRPVPNKVILPAILSELNDQGIGDDQVVIIIATGMHRPATDEERDILVGQEILRRCELIDHRADDPTGLVQIDDNPPASVNRRYHEADFRIVTGLIEPHFMAGYSGGRKGLCPALVDLDTIQRLHGHRILADALSTTGVLEGNPCHAESLRIARMMGTDFLVNVAINHNREAAGVYCGDLERAHLVGCDQVAQWNGVTVDEPYDLIVTNGGGFPLDQTYYQTGKGFVAALPAAHEKSIILIASACVEGIGSPQFGNVLSRWHDDWQGFLDHIASTDRVEKDQWQFQVNARVLAKIGVERLWFVSDGLPADEQTRLAVTPVLGDGNAATRMQRTIDRYVDDHPDARIAIMPDGPYTMLLAPNLQPV